MATAEEFVSLQDAIEYSINEFGEESNFVRILNAVMNVLIANDYYPQEIALQKLEELCR